MMKLVKDGVLEQTSGSEWASPTFIVPKKDGRVRWVSDFLGAEQGSQETSLPATKDTGHHETRYDTISSWNS